MKLLLLVVCAILDGPVECTLSMFTPSGYVGCFFSYPGFLTSIHYKHLTVSFSNTGSECKTRCKAEGFRYAGTVARLNCFCGNGIYSLTPASDCNVTCTGNKLEYCGGDWHMSLYKIWQSSSKWLTSGSKSPVYFIRNAKMDYGSCVDFCEQLKPMSEVAVFNENAELWLQKNKLIEASKNYWISKTSQFPHKCYYITGTDRESEIHCDGQRHSLRDSTCKSSVKRASSCTLKNHCICQQRA